MGMTYDIPKDEIRSGRFILDGETWVKERTCQMEYSGNISGFLSFDTWMCSECGCEMYDVEEHPNYCSNCGSKAVE